MWNCSKCGRKFKNVGQSHYCGDKPKTIDEYILSQEESIHVDLNIIRNTFKKKHNIIHFAAAKKHIGIYHGTAAVEYFAKDPVEYKTDKGTIRIPYGKVDTDLIYRIAKWCMDTGNHA